MAFFHSTAVPTKHRRNPVAHQTHWLTWGTDVARFFDVFGTQIDRLAIPRKISVNGCSPYDCSYSYSLSRIEKALSKHVVYLSESLLSYRVGRTINLLTQMIEPPMTSLLLGKFFAFLRPGVIRLTEDPNT